MKRSKTPVAVDSGSELAAQPTENQSEEEPRVDPTATATESGGTWTVTVEVTGTGGPIDEAASDHDSIAYVIVIECPDGSFTFVCQRHLGDPINGENPNDSSAPPAEMMFGPNSVTFEFELPDNCEKVNQVVAKAFASKVVEATDQGANFTDGVTVETEGPGS